MSREFNLTNETNQRVWAFTHGNPRQPAVYDTGYMAYSFKGIIPDRANAVY